MPIPTPVALDKYASVAHAPTAVPFEMKPRGLVFRGMSTLESAKEYAQEVAEFFAANGTPQPVFVVHGPTSTTRKAFEVVDASCGYSIAARINP